MKLSKGKLEALKDVLRARDEALLAAEKYGKDVQVDLQTGELQNASNDLKKA